MPPLLADEDVRRHIHFYSPWNPQPHTHLGSARMASLKGWNNNAQGNTLGIDVVSAKALKGRQNRSLNAGLVRVI